MTKPRRSLVAARAIGRFFGRCATYTVADILDTNYQGQSPGFGLAAQQWASTYKLYEINQANNIFYVPDVDEATNTRFENYNSYVGQQKDLKESTDAWYAMLTGRFFSNRLSMVGGMRQEENEPCRSLPVYGQQVELCEKC